jgi:ribulose-5-phosphate 4-epimerase/fuculose-1-phosphate aldolase
MTATATPPVQDRHAGALELEPADEQARGELLAAVEQLHQAEVLPFTGSSNGSVRLRTRLDRVLLSARGLRSDLRAEDFGVVDLDGTLRSGWLDSHVQPVIAMHTAVYTAHPEVNAVLHTHSTNATAFAVARRPIPLHYEPLLYRGLLEEIPVTAYGRRSQGDLVGRVTDALEAHGSTKALLLANHGLLAWDSSPLSAATLVVTIEEAAAIILAASPLGGSKAIPT